MKLIIREYLSSLRERDELDALLPDLLSQMGLDVFSKPGVGGRQYGVDVAAVGGLDGRDETVYLFSVKSGDLGRADWNGGSVQALRPSLDDILDTYIPTHLPVEHKDKPIEICLCFGGNIKENVRLSVTTYTEKHTTDNIKFSEWNGEKLANYVESYLLREELLPDNCRPLLRKSLALLDEPQSSYGHFSRLIRTISNVDHKKQVDTLTAIRQLYISLWILYAWCRDQDNLESAYLSSEIVALHAWDVSKPYFGKNKKLDREIHETLTAILNLHIQITSDFVETKVFPHADNLHALSSGVVPSCAVDVNLKLFDILGRVALSGIWSYLYLLKFEKTEENSELISNAVKRYKKHQDVLIQLIVNNPVLFTPYKDDQAIDIAIAALFLSLDDKQHSNLNGWLMNMMENTYHLLSIKGCYPCNLQSYHDLIDHPQNSKEDYFEEVTAGSTLYTTIAAFSALLNFDDLYLLVQKIKTDFLEHCNFQVWYPNKASEENFYKNGENHGATFSHVSIDEDKKVFLNSLFKECDELPHFNQLSAITMQQWPLIMVACRHYRFPVPIHFLRDLHHQIKEFDASEESV